MTKFPKISCPKLTEGIFIGPQSRKLINDEEFIATLKEDEKNAWLAFIDVVKHFLGNNKSPTYARIVENMISKFHKLEYIRNLKFHFMDSHLNYFSDNLSAESEEQGERFHQDIKIIEQRYNGLWNQHMMAENCWILMRDDKQDNVRPHTAHISQHVLYETSVLPWPPVSPDLSPIEHVWNLIGRRLYALPQLRSEDELWLMADRTAIPQDTILIESVPRRVDIAVVPQHIGSTAMSLNV
ncbi:hypothetical protein LAZ67_12002550 [Cordylochernes scorpioides]|uniref:Tc1-like transposase DDE domain-containing protein n=1 Tax=Cordylochernes scorpioides TaxID=51811 RepID=A0ABY6L4L5_9ARAC|nr:hypothetical protein LAZ67_12002550 [Cordylochernes scorpioides]